MAGIHNTNSYLSRRPMVLGLAKVLFLSLSQVPMIQAAPLGIAQLFAQDEVDPKPAADPSLWLYFGVAVFLVVAGGAFAGLTIALMGQDEIYLQVIRDSGEGKEVKHAAKVLNLLSRGKHWVLVTLLLSNVITNETLPVVLDRSLGGGWPAVLASTVLVVVFGEVVPQSICVRYGLPIGAFMSPAVLVLMYVLAPVAWPTAKLLDYLLGADHGTMYKKAGLKTLVSLHRNLGESGQRLHADEVTIISAVLDLKEKPIGSIMTPMEDVFTLSLDDILDEPTMDDILSQGYSRVPIHHPDNNENFVGMLLVKMLITYDPEDAKPVRDFALATLPETSPNTSCLDIVNFFQEGKSHMVLVSDHPGEDHGSLGVVTLEDVIEELIGEEIIDESDVFVDVHKAIRRIAPAPRNKYPRMTLTGATPRASNAELIKISENNALETQDLVSPNEPAESGMLKDARRVSGVSVIAPPARTSTKASLTDIREHLKHLGPSNLASRPKTTRFTSVKIKPGAEGGDAVSRRDASMDTERRASLPNDTERQVPTRRISFTASDYGGGIGEGLLPSGGKVASDGVQALANGYGTLSTSDKRPPSRKSLQGEQLERNNSSPKERTNLMRPTTPRVKSHDTIDELPERRMSKSPIYRVGGARSGSITENIVDTNGIRKVVLETTSSSESSDDNDAGGKSKKASPRSSDDSTPRHKDNGRADTDQTVSKKKRRRRKKDNRSRDETEPLLH